MNTPSMMKYECPMCDKEIVTLWIDHTVPSTWNDCCSPECGWELGGYLQAVEMYVRPVDAARDVRLQQKRWNEWEHWRLITLKAEAQRDCDHAWKVSMGEIQQTMYNLETQQRTTTSYQALVCRKCDSTKQGEVIGHSVR